jgi:hypothetical protein
MKDAAVRRFESPLVRRVEDDRFPKGERSADLNVRSVAARQQRDQHISLEHSCELLQRDFAMTFGARTIESSPCKRAFPTLSFERFQQRNSLLAAVFSSR